MTLPRRLERGLSGSLLYGLDIHLDSHLVPNTKGRSLIRSDPQTSVVPVL